jgi:hypothetical protein
MKTFSNFLKEATETAASKQAKQLNLVGDGHGGWYDKTGNFVAKTENGKLRFYGKGGKKPDEKTVDKKKPKETVIQKTKSAPKQVAQQQKVKTVDPQKVKSKSTDDTGETGSKNLVVVFGRFNPPTVGHEKLLKAAANEAKKGEADLKIYPSRTQDSKKNPLDAGVKIGFMKDMFPDYKDNIVNDADTKTIFDALTSAYGNEYSNVTIVVGQDRLSEFQGLAQKYNGTDLYNFENIVVISGGARDPDADDVTGMSASKMRAYAADNDFESFSKGVPTALDSKKKRELFSAVRSSMNMKESFLWEIAPKLDPESLRESYINKEIFNLGDNVQNVNTGIIGRVMRRGANYLIYVTEGGMMFKSWLKDLQEYTEVKMDRMMRDKIHPNTLVGTKGFLEYVKKMTPGYDKGVKIAKQYK